MLEDALVVAEGNAQDARVLRAADVLQALVAAGALLRSKNPNAQTLCAATKQGVCARYRTL